MRFVPATVLRSLFAAALFALIGLVPARLAHAQGCATCVPLDDLTGPVYRGRAPGLYDGGTNAPPAAHAALALSAASQVVPRDTTGAPSAAGLIGWLSIGMSNTNQEWAAFEFVEDSRLARNPRLVLVNGAEGGKSADVIVNPTDPFWTHVGTKIVAAGLRPEQIQVVWLKEARGAVPDTSFPVAADSLRLFLHDIVRDLKSRFPNLSLCYVSSRTYGGWTTNPQRGEPLSYETAFAFRDLIRDQANGDPTLNADPDVGAVVAPVLLWGPYLWIRGNTPRASDGATWPIGDVETDLIHPSPSGESKVAVMIAHWLAGEPSAAPWKDAPTGEWSEVIPAEADAWVLDSQPSANNGLDSVLVWSNASARAYVRFDLSAVTGAVLHAKLALNGTANDEIPRADVVSIANHAWNETTITAGNAPSPNGVALGTLGSYSRGSSPSLDVTAAVRAAIAAGPGAKLSLVLRSLAGPTTPQRISSRESVRPPRLVLSLAPAPVGAPERAVAADLALAPLVQPFRGAGRVRLVLPRDEPRVDVTLHDAQGRLVRALARGARAAGEHVLAWDGRDDAGQALPAGVYVVRARAGAGAASAKVVLLRP